LPAITPRLIAIATLAVAFVVMTMTIPLGVFSGLDQQVAQATHSAWQPSLHPLFQAIAELGGFELTTLLMIGLSIYMLRRGFGSDAWVIVVFIAADVLEVLYKFNLHHPGPPRSISQSDGPSLTQLVEGSSAINSFPSGHMVRAVVVYGLLAFVVRRLSPSPLIRRLAIPIAILLIVLVAFDRLYLDVHWETDVVGGLLLGAIALLAGTVWLDRPRKPEN
jgi:membrane-associated phospholipid phosphatase